MSRTTYNGNDLDRTIPYTPAAYTQITDSDYYPLPGADNNGENDMTELTIEQRHRLMVMDLAKGAESISEDMGFDLETNIHAMHAALGIAGEGGEVVDLVKKSVINGKKMDVLELTKELGDLEWYLTLLRSAYGITRDEVLTMNIDKLRTRYAQGYSDRASAERIDMVSTTRPDVA